MDSVDTALRLMILGQLLLVTLVVAFREPKKVALPLGLLMLAVAAYLTKSSPQLAASLSAFETPIYFLAMGAPYVVWACSYALFEFERPHWAWLVFLPCVTFSLCTVVTAFANPPPLLNALSIIASLTAVTHAIYAIVKGNRDDLFEPRRRFRLCFVVCISLLTAFVLIQELVLIGQTTPPFLHFVNVVLIGTVLMFLSVPLLSNDLAAMPKQFATPDPPDIPQLEFADQHSYGKLMKAMESRAYARTGLTIRHLADELDVPEHRLRKLINQRLGHRNFSAFLNGYRLEEACQRLQNPAEARIPILTIALDAGFASLAPFNRAFKAKTGLTPTEYRRSQNNTSPSVTKITRSL